MAIEVFKVKISSPEPETHFIKNVPTLIVTDKNGNKSVMGWRTFVGKLHTKIMTVEARGYESNVAVPNLTGSSTTLTATEVDGNGNIVSTDSFDEKTVTFDSQRINEADFWRITKTVTIRALYSNGKYIAGKTTFDAGDSSI
jgi:hypothetical protein